MAPCFSEVPVGQYFRVDVQDQLPECEVNRRDTIKKELEAQFQLWQTEEQHLWLAIPESNTISFLGLDRFHWSCILPILKEYFSRIAAFGLLSELQLSVIRTARTKTHLRDGAAPETWLYKQYRQYGIRIQDFGDKIKQYRVPLIEIAVAPNQNPANPALFQKSTYALVSRMLPERTSAFRVVIFPQTRYSFIEDEIFHALYPLPEEEAKLMSHTLLQRFQANDGYHNVFPDPFADSFVQKTHDFRDFRYLAAMYPVIDFEFVLDYERRKKSERFVTLMQQQTLRDSKGIPAISQWRYSRKFDFAEESTLRTESFQGDSCAERIQSARALFEYACGDHDTIGLDCRQISAEHNESRTHRQTHLLVVDPLWLIIFPDADTICAFRNENMVDHFEDIWGKSIDPQNWGQVLVRIVNNADKCMGSYEPTYRKRLSSLQYKIHTITERCLNKDLIKYLSEFVAELTILLDPLQAQIKALQSWQQYQHTALLAKSQPTDSTFDDAIKTRDVHLESLKRLLYRARELQTLLFQISNIDTANLQSEIAIEMAKETQVQVNLAKRNDSQNKSIMVFTVITVIFLPLSFFTSYFGMNTVDVRTMNGGQGFFWSIAGPISIVVISFASFIAFRDRIEENPFRIRLRSEKQFSTSNA